MTRTGFLTALGVTLSVAFPTFLLLMSWGLISPCPQVPDDLPEWAIPLTAWSFLLSPVFGLLVGAVVVRRGRAARTRGRAQR